MPDMTDSKWGVKLDDIKDVAGYNKLDKRWQAGWSKLVQRTALHEMYSRVAHNLSLFHKQRKDMWSEGSTQRAMRKARAQSLQRVPDGDLWHQYDVNSIEAAEIEFIWKHVIIEDDTPGKDMLKTLWRAFNQSWIYGPGILRTDFVGCPRKQIKIEYTLLGWRDVVPDPDCKHIEEAEWYIIREWISKSELENLLNEEGSVIDSTWNEDVIHYVLENETKSGIWTDSQKLTDKEKGITPIESVEIRTMYRKGDSEFVTWCVPLNAPIRTVPNYDPWLDVPVHTLVLDPDPEYPLGASSVFWTMTEQQFLDALHSISGQVLLESFEPPLLVPQNLTNENYEMRPNAIWNKGTNPQMTIEKFPVETTSLTQRSNLMESASAKMLSMLGITDQTPAAGSTPGYSKTPQGVEFQRQDRTVTMNQYMKRIEIFFSELTGHACRSYLNSMGGVQKVLVDEKTRRKIFDVESSLIKDDPTYESIIEGNYVKVDFSALSGESFFFDIRTGSTMETQQEQQQKALADLFGPIPQSLQALQNSPYQNVFADIMVQIVQRMAEISGTDISVKVSDQLEDAVARQALKATMDKVMEMDQQMQMLQGGGMPPEDMMQEDGVMPPEAQVPAELPELEEAAQIEEPML